MRIAVEIFYKDVHVQGKERLPSRGPLIVAVNHPNTLMDPLLVSLQLKQRTGFLAKSGIFANAPLKWIFSKLHLIPVYRQQDQQEGSAASNKDTFRKCYEYLLAGGTLMIFPEGSSFNEMKLRKLKTGTARIALETAALRDFKSGMLISPVSLTYSDPIRFRSKLFMRVDEPIVVDVYADAYRQDPVAAVQQLTDVLRDKLEKNLVITEHKDQELLLMRIKKLYKDHLQEKNRKLLSKDEEFVLLQQIAQGMIHYQRNRAADYTRIQQKVQHYFDCLEETELKEGFFAADFSTFQKVLFLGLNALYLLLTLPFYLLGLITNYLPYILPSHIARWLGADIEYRAGIMMLSGLFLFPLYYLLMCFGFYAYISKDILLTFLFAVSLPIQGFFVLHYWRIMEKTSSLIRYMSLKKKKNNLLLKLSALRWDIKAELETVADVLASEAIKE